MIYFFSQELSQADISVLKKAELKDRLGVIRKTFDKEIKDREALTNKIVSGLYIESKQ
jgi:alanyl-tRNA synthetase